MHAVLTTRTDFRCHFTSTDLICTAESGAAFIVRHYKDVFRAAAELASAERAEYVVKHTIIIGLGSGMKQLATYRDHIVVCTVSIQPHNHSADAQQCNVILLDGKKIPEIPAEISSEEQRPKLRAHVLLGNHPQALKFSTCVQADARSIYLTYWAGGEVEAAVGVSPGNVSFPPLEAIEGFGFCVKVWTFGLE